MAPLPSTWDMDDEQDPVEWMWYGAAAMVAGLIVLVSVLLCGQCMGKKEKEEQAKAAEQNPASQEKSKRDGSQREGSKKEKSVRERSKREGQPPPIFTPSTRQMSKRTETSKTSSSISGKTTGGEGLPTIMKLPLKKREGESMSLRASQRSILSQRSTQDNSKTGKASSAKAKACTKKSQKGK